MGWPSVVGAPLHQKSHAGRERSAHIARFVPPHDETGGSEERVPDGRGANGRTGMRKRTDGDAQTDGRGCGEMETRTVAEMRTVVRTGMTVAPRALQAINVEHPFKLVESCNGVVYQYSAQSI